MSTLIETANELGTSFILSKNKEQVATYAISKINALVYAGSKQSLEYPVKVEIIKLTEEFISLKTTESKDSIMFLEMKDYILKQLNTSKVNH